MCDLLTFNSLGSCAIYSLGLEPMSIILPDQLIIHYVLDNMWAHVIPRFIRIDLTVHKIVTVIVTD